MTKSTNRLSLLLALSAAAGLMGTVAAHGDTLRSKSDRFLAGAATKSAARRTNVIVRLAGPLTAAQGEQLKALGVEIKQRFEFICSLAASLPARNLDRLAALPFVRHLSADLQVKKCDEFTVESSVADVAAAQYGLDGSGVSVAVIDSGITHSDDLGKTKGAKERLFKGRNFVPDADGKVNSDDTEDRCGHGTHVAGIIGGNGANSSEKKCYRTFYGIARGAGLVPVRALDANGQGSVSQVLQAIQWVIQNKDANNIKVMNLSLGHPVGESYSTDPLCQAVEAAWNAGIVVVCSAGNSGRLQDATDQSLDNEGHGTAYGSIQSPANDPLIITVGAMKAMDMAFNADGTHTHNRNNDRVTTYSSRGPSRLDFVLKPDIMAPGNKVISLEASNKCTLYNSAGDTNDIRLNEYTVIKATALSNKYFRLSGTSMAAPVVSGAATLMFQKDSSLSPDTVKARMMLSADKWKQADGTTDPCTFGAGYLNIAAALANKCVVNMAAASPTLSVDPEGMVSLNMDRAIWGHDATGAAAIWGISGVNDLRAIWGHDTFADSVSSVLKDSRAIWGHSITAERAIWGHSVWEDRALWGHAIEGVDLSSTALYGE